MGESNTEMPFTAKVVAMLNRKWGQLLVILLSLLLMGELLVKPQHNLTNDLRTAQLLPDELSSENQIEIGQTGAAVALGGLRSLIAAVMNLQAYGAFEVQDWVELEQLYEMTVTLQPKNTYYWESGGWHLAYNAYYDFEDKLGMTSARAKFKQREYHSKGEEFLLRGAEENPGDLGLWQDLGRLYTAPHKPYDFARAAGYFEKALESPRADDRMKREYFYTIGRVAGREEEALRLGDELYERGNNFRYSSMRALYYALRVKVDPALAKDDALIEKVFKGDKRNAYRDMANYWLRTKSERFPREGLSVAINRLAIELNVSDSNNPLKNSKMGRLRLVN